MSKINPKNSTVLFTGILTAVVQWYIGSTDANRNTTEIILGAILTVAVAVHGAITSSIFDGNHTHTLQSVDKADAEVIQILGDVQQNLGEK